MNKSYLSRETKDGTQLTIEQIAAICPSAVTEVRDENTGEIVRKVNFTTLRQLLGDLTVDTPREAYDFTWVGKNAARREAAAPIDMTLRPCVEESKEWDTTKNLYIEGDNLQVLKLLQNYYAGQIKMIYIDPPYNTGKDFVYHDDFHQSQSDYEAAAGVRDELGNSYYVNNDSNGRFHSDWCSMIYARLMVAQTLLSKDGAIFISIDHNEVGNLKNIADEVFGESNRIGIISTINNLKGRSDDEFFATCNEFLLVYANDRKSLALNGFEVDEEEIERDYDKKDEISYYKLIGYRKTGNAWKREERPYMFYPVLLKENSFSTVNEDELKRIYNSDSNTFDDVFLMLLKEKYESQGFKFILPKAENGEYGRWRWGLDTFLQQKDNNLELNNSGTLCTKMRATIEDGSVRVKTAKTLWYKPEYDTGSSAKILKELFKKGDLFDNPKSLIYLKDIVKIATNQNAIILDFFSGSSTTAHAVMSLNAEDKGKRTFIMVQLDETTEIGSEPYKAGYKNICEIGKERIRRAGKKIKEENPNVQDLDTGFRVLKLDESNFKQVSFPANQYSQDMLAGLWDNIKDDRTDLDLLFDCMLRWGVELSLPIERTEADHCQILNVNDGDLVACLDRNGKVTESVIDAIATMQPLRIVLLDTAFEEASQKMNIYELFKQRLGWSDDQASKQIRVI